ncbi:hypothetical protein A7P53_07670 [Acinetobacter defluvii]|uniref:TPR end-of-group domain-containing protein n=1 Tax=Acinetobacter defluvii TaxID=1871111 RepID=UPI00148FA373|nr:hypothetical protein [Acinetobacter defluvii]NNP72341.1 hypothetical protein [Acinetobacter defluvii]
MSENRDELLKHLAASLKDAKEDGGATLLVGAGISVSAGIPPAFKLMKIAIENFPNYFTEEEQHLAQEDLSQLQYNDIMTKLSNVKRKELFKWFIEGNEEKRIEKAKLNFAHIAIAELLKQGYFSRILTVNFDPLLIHACYMVGMYPFPAIYDLGAMGKVNAELLHDPSIVYLNGQHVGFVQRNTTDQLKAHKETLTQIVRSTGCNKTWVVAGYSGENDPLMYALNELRPYNNWLYWLEYGDQVLQKESHHFLENDEECKVIYGCDADETFMEVAENLRCSLDFIEYPDNELKNYLKEIDFSSNSRRIISYKNQIQSYIELFAKHRLEIQQINAFHQILNKAISLIPIEKSLKNKNLINERLENLYSIKSALERSLRLNEKSYSAFILLSYSYLSIYQIKKDENLLIEEDNELLDLVTNILERIKVTKEYHTNLNNERSLVFYNQACLECLKGNINQGLKNLEKSFSNNDLSTNEALKYEEVKNDPDLRIIWNNPEFDLLCNLYLKDN